MIFFNMYESISCMFLRKMFICWFFRADLSALFAAYVDSMQVELN